jgi:hypothetical protein
MLAAIGGMSNRCPDRTPRPTRAVRAAVEVSVATSRVGAAGRAGALLARIGFVSKVMGVLLEAGENGRSLLF